MTWLDEIKQLRAKIDKTETDLETLRAELLHAFNEARNDDPSVTFEQLASAAGIPQPPSSS